MTTAPPAPDLDMRRRHALLADASVLLDATLEPATVLGTLGRLLVPALGDFCLVDAVLDDQILRRVQLAHDADSDCAALLGLPVPSLTMPRATARIVQHGLAQLHAGLTDGLRSALALEPALAAAFETVAPSSVLAVPLSARGRQLGAMLIGTRQGGDRFTAADLAFAADIGRRAGLTLDNARLFQRAQRATAARDALLTIVSHDLQAPLGALAMCTQALRVTHPDAATGRVADSVDEAVRWMQRLIRDLLDVASIEAGRLAIVPRATDPLIIAVKACSLFEGEAAARSLQLLLDAPESLPQVHADGERITQVLANLLSNALRHTPSGGRVVLRLEETAAGVAFTVSDTGGGIEPDALPHVFDRFWHARGPSGVRGTGLGLAIAQGLATAHGARLRVASRIDEGTTFRFELARAIPVPA